MYNILYFIFILFSLLFLQVKFIFGYGINDFGSKTTIFVLKPFPHALLGLLLRFALKSVFVLKPFFHALLGFLLRFALKLVIVLGSKVQLNLTNSLTEGPKLHEKILTGTKW